MTLEAPTTRSVSLPRPFVISLNFSISRRQLMWPSVPREPLGLPGKFRMSRFMRPARGYMSVHPPAACCLVELVPSNQPLRSHLTKPHSSPSSSHKKLQELKPSSLSNSSSSESPTQSNPSPRYSTTATDPDASTVSTATIQLNRQR